MKLVTLITSKNDWVIKASVFDETLLIFCYNVYTMKALMHVSYDEQAAFEFIESLK